MPKGVYVKTKEHIQRIQESRKWYKKHSKETIKKMSEAKLNKKNPMFGKKHSKEWKRQMSERLKKNQNSFKGGIINHKGYILILKPNHPFATKAGYVLEHRLVVEKQIGRYLEPEEIVHHINFNRSDNSPQNLCIFKNRNIHRAFHILLNEKMIKKNFFKNNYHLTYSTIIAV